MLETFVHGAMCMSYSGRCLISNFLADRSANQGKCAHCCRWHYRLHVRLKDGTVRDLNITPENRGMFEFLVKEDFRPGELYEIIEDEHGAYIMNSKDLCLMPRLNSLLDIGMHSLKIEGRNKTEYYAAITARSYRQAIDDYRRDPKNWSPDRYMDELYTLQNRGYCLGFYDGHLTNLSQNYEYTRTLGDWLFAGSIVEWQGDDIIFEVRNYINGGEFIEFLVPGSLENVRLALNEFEDADSGEITPRVSAGQGKKIRIPAAAFGRSAEIVREKLPQYTVARKPAALQTDAREMLDRKRKNLPPSAGRIELSRKIPPVVSDPPFKFGLRPFAFAPGGAHFAGGVVQQFGNHLTVAPVAVCAAIRLGPGFFQKRLFHRGITLAPGLFDIGGNFGNVFFLADDFLHRIQPGGNVSGLFVQTGDFAVNGYAVVLTGRKRQRVAIIFDRAGNVRIVLRRQISHIVVSPEQNRVARRFALKRAVAAVAAKIGHHLPSRQLVLPKLKPGYRFRRFFIGGKNVFAAVSHRHVSLFIRRYALKPPLPSEISFKRYQTFRRLYQAKSRG